MDKAAMTSSSLYPLIKICCNQVYQFEYIVRNVFKRPKMVFLKPLTILLCLDYYARILHIKFQGFFVSKTLVMNCGSLIVYMKYLDQLHTRNNLKDLLDASNNLIIPPSLFGLNLDKKRIWSRKQVRDFPTAETVVMVLVGMVEIMNYFSVLVLEDFFNNTFTSW